MSNYKISAKRASQKIGLITKDELYSIQDGCHFVLYGDGSIALLDCNEGGLRPIAESIPYRLFDDQYAYVFKDIDEMSVWIANGRNPKYLRGDTIPMRDMEKGQVAEVVEWHDAARMIGRFIMRADTEVDAFIRLDNGGRWVIGTDAYASLLANSKILVWPLTKDDELVFTFGDQSEEG